MTRLREWIVRLLGTLRHGRRDRELEEELRLHLDLVVEDARRDGRSLESATRTATIHAGGMAQAVEAMRDQRGLPWLEDAVRDVRYAVRLLRRNPGFTTVAVLALALGIGIDTAVVTAYKAMVARPLDARDPGEMVNLALSRQGGATTFTFSYPDYEAFRDGVHAFSGLIAFSPERMTLSNAGGIVSQRTAAAGTLIGRLGLLPSGAGNAEFASVSVVSENYFEVLGVEALRGRTFESIGDRELVASPSVLVSENYWQRRFSGDPALLGRTIHLNGTAVTVVGITPHDFVGTGIAVPDFWLPLSLEPLVHADEKRLRDREIPFCRLFARLAPGVNIGQAQAEMSLVADHLRTLHDPHSESATPGTVLVWPGSPFPLPMNQYAGLQLTVLLIMVAAGMVLAVACANVASLQLARAGARQNELHTRLAIGASRRRVIRQLLTESALLALVAGGVALLLAWALLAVSVSLVAGALPAEYGSLVFHVTPDLEIFTFVFAISVAAGVLFGLAPAIESSRSALSSAVRAGTSPFRRRRLQDVLIAAQVALSLVLMIVGSMLIRSSMNSIKTDTGYDARHVVDLEVQFPETSKYTPEHKAALVRELRTRLAALPGVEAITSARPPDDNRFQTAAVSLGEKSPVDNVPAILSYTYVQPNYFATVNVPLISGRGFQKQAGEPEHSVILSESAAKRLWPGQNPLGRSLRLGATDERLQNRRQLRADGPAYEVVGVARDTRGTQFDGGPSRQVYLPLPDARLESRPILIRTQFDTAPLTRAIDPVIASIDPDLVATSSTLDERLRRAGPFVVSSLSAAVASSLGLLGLLLASMGLYGTVSYIVVLRTREVGIRMAVGAQKHDILGLILRESTRPVLAGLLVGMLLAVGTSYLLRGLFYGLGTIDGISIVGVSVLFLAIALFAAYPPSRRALRVEPVVALRYE